jgi:DNA (cytosine-5)-methyltransferase 1
LVAHTLRAEGFDASEDGTGRGTPLVASTITAQIGEQTGQDARNGNLIAFDTTQLTSAANRSNPKPGDPCHPMAAGAHAPAIAFHGSQDPDVSGDITHPVGRNQGQETCAMVGAVVRRLMPLECERLQGFRDGYTAIPWRGKTAADGPRYKALGNSWAVNCARELLGRQLRSMDRPPH